MKNFYHKTILLLVCTIIGISLKAENTLKILDWNVLSFEQMGKVGERNGFPIKPFIDKINEENPDIICLNEFETATSRMGKGKMTEMAAQLGFFAYFIESYPKSGGYYGNVILSRYPIISSASKKFPYKNVKGEGYYDHNSGKYLQDYGSDQRSVGYIDILYPKSNTENEVVRIICSHFDHGVSPEAIRKKQAEILLDFAIDKNNPNKLHIIAGDLNTTNAVSTLSPIYDKSDLQIYDWLDYIFSYPKGKAIRKANGHISSNGLSDHNGIWVEISF